MGAMKCLVTGAAGFVGAGVCQRLLQAGHEVYALVRPDTRRWRLAEVASDIHFVEVDLRDRHGVEHVVRTVEPQVVYHLATHGAYPFQEDADGILLTNIFGFWNLISACNAVGYELFVNVGSSSEYGRKRHAMRETDLLEPDSFYAVAKAGQTLLSRHVARLEDRPIVTFRLFSVYGPWEEPSRLFPALMRAALRGEVLDMVSPDTCRDFIHVDDVCAAFLDIDRLKACRGEVYNLGTGVQTALRDLVALTGSVAGQPLAARWGEMPPRVWDTDVWVADIRRAVQDLGWRPRLDLRAGIAQTLAWYRDHPQALDAQ